MPILLRHKNFRRRSLFFLKDRKTDWPSLDLMIKFIYSYILIVIRVSIRSSIFGFKSGFIRFEFTFYPDLINLVHSLHPDLINPVPLFHPDLLNSVSYFLIVRYIFVLANKVLIVFFFIYRNVFLKSTDFNKKGKQIFKKKFRYTITFYY